MYRIPGAPNPKGHHHGVVFPAFSRVFFSLPENGELKRVQGMKNSNIIVATPTPCISKPFLAFFFWGIQISATFRCLNRENLHHPKGQ